jgi:DNA-binding NtrC family response regulator
VEAVEHYFLVFDRDDSRRLALPGVDGELVIGRGDQAELRLRDASVSRRHAVVHVRKGEVWVRDLESHNGILVNGVRVDEETRLAPHDVLTLGKVALVYQASGGMPAESDLETGEQPTERVSGRASGAGGRRYDLGNEDAFVADPAMTRVYSLLERLADSDLPVLLVGELGAGKRTAAAALHHLSKRKPRRFLSLEATEIEPGEAPIGGSAGTVLIEDVAELSADGQARLLKAVQARRTRSEEGPRYVLATRRDLDEEIKAGRFREELYLSIGGATVWIPPLRDRLGELPLLAQRFLDEARKAMGRPLQVLSPVALRTLTAYGWPGNVGELRQAMEYAAATAAAGVVEPDQLPAKVIGRPLAADASGKEAPIPLDDEIRQLEKRRMEEALAATAGNQTRAAARLGMPRRTFVAKLKQYEIDRRRGPGEE